MANFPFAGFQIPSADPPYPIHIMKDNIILLSTDNCGTVFTVYGDKQAAAIACVEYFYKCLQSYILKEEEIYIQRIGPIDIFHQNKTILAVKPHYITKQEYIEHTPEDRPEVLEMIDLIRSSAKSMMKMKVFW